MAVSIMTSNSGGLRNTSKLTNFIHHVMSFNTDFVFLQETHLTHLNIKHLTQIWKGSVFYAPGGTFTGGVAILGKHKSPAPK